MGERETEEARIIKWAAVNGARDLVAPVALAGTSCLRPGPIGARRVESRANRGGLCAGGAAAVRAAHPTAGTGLLRAEPWDWLGSRGWPPRAVDSEWSGRGRGVPRGSCSYRPIDM